MTENSASSFRRPRRRLTAAELELWFEVTRGIAPRPGHSVERPPVKLDRGPDPCEAPPPKGAGSDGATQAAPRLRLAPIERRLRQKLSRGRAAPDAVIDLHGMRRQEAFLALRKFLLRAQSGGARLVLVITGKGASTDLSPGILRKSVPDWLRGSEYQAIVAGFEEAARPHGGSGALYVRLRRCSQPATENLTS